MEMLWVEPARGATGTERSAAFSSQIQAASAPWPTHGYLRPTKTFRHIRADKETAWERNGMLVYESPLSRDAPAEEVAEIFVSKEWLPENRRNEAIKTLNLSSLDITPPTIANSPISPTNT